MKQITKFVKLEQLFLDPNNYRFLDDEMYVPVPEEAITQQSIQQRCMRMLIGRGQENISDLKASFYSNGFLDLEPIQVRALFDDKYLVLEGNRRIATLKYFYDLYSNSEATGKIEKTSFENIKISVVDAKDSQEHLITMGLHHISGKKRWNPLNQSQMVKDLYSKYGMPVDEICNSLGVSKQFVNKCLRVLALIDSYKKSDFGDQFQTNKYSFFEEILKSVNIREWLGWSNETMQCENKENEYRLFSWFSSIEDDEMTDDVIFGKHITKEPIITKSVEFRSLGEFIKDENALVRMEKTRSVNEAYKVSEKIGRNRVDSSIDTIDRELSNLFSYSEYLYDEDNTRILNLELKIRRLIREKKAQSTNFKTYCFGEKGALFSSVLIHEYRGFRDLNLSGISRFNLFVGSNNSGKTKLLEAIYLLVQMNDLNKLLEIEKFRSRSEEPTLKWIIDNLNERYKIEGIFNGVKCMSETIINSDESTVLDKTGYLKSLMNKSSIGNSNKKFNMSMHIYNGRDNIQNFNELVNICPALFTSPYRANRGMLIDAHQKVVNNGEMRNLIEYIRSKFDKSISDIRLVDTEVGGRFIVTSTSLPKGRDLTKYGEGMIRVFEISLYIIASANGCVFIDELDSGIHTELLPDFVDYIMNLAKRFNVQLFMTTHNGELVSSFANSDYRNELMAYRIENELPENTTRLVPVDGNRLNSLISNFKLDIR